MSMCMVHGESLVGGYTAVEAVSWTGERVRHHNVCSFLKYLLDDGSFRLETCRRYSVKLNCRRCAAVGWF